MPRISEMPAPGALTGLELLPILQGSEDASLPLFAQASIPRGAVLQLRRPFLADLSATADADPGAGNLRWNNANPLLATFLYIDDAATDAADISLAWTNLQVGGFAYVQKAGDTADRANWQKWQITSIVDAAGYAKLGVNLQASAGTFADDDMLELSLQQPTPAPGVDRSAVTVLSIVSGVVTVDCSLGDYFTLALNANVTSWVFTNVPAGASIMVEITQDSTPRTVAWVSALKWSGGTPAVSTTSGAKDMLALTTFNAGGAWRATLAKAFA